MFVSQKCALHRLVKRPPAAISTTWLQNSSNIQGVFCSKGYKTLDTKLQKITITMILYVNTKEIVDAEFIYFLFFLFISINTLLLWQHHFMSKIRNIVVGCILSNGKWFCVFVLIIILVRFIIPSLELGKKCIGCHDVNLPVLCPLHVCLFLFWWTTSLLSHWYITHICHLYTFTDICTFFLFLIK